MTDKNDMKSFGKGLGLILLWVSVLSTFIMGNIQFTDAGLNSYFPFISILTFSMCLMLSFLAWTWSKNQRIELKAFLNFQAAGTIIISLFIGANLLHYKLSGRKVYAQRFGHCMSSMSLITANSLGQSAIKKLLNYTPEGFQYQYYLLEDGCRSINLKKTFTIAFPKSPNFCKKEQTPSECVFETIKYANSNAPFVASAQVLPMSVGILIILKDKDINLKKSPHDLLIPAKATIQLAKLAKHIHQTTNKFATIDKLFPKMESREIASLKFIEKEPVTLANKVQIRNMKKVLRIFKNRLIAECPNSHNEKCDTYINESIYLLEYFEQF